MRRLMYEKVFACGMGMKALMSEAGLAHVDMDGWIHLIFVDQEGHYNLGTIIGLSCIRLVFRNALRVI